MKLGKLLLKGLRRTPKKRRSPLNSRRAPLGRGFARVSAKGFAARAAAHRRDLNKKTPKPVADTAPAAAPTPSTTAVALPEPASVVHSVTEVSPRPRGLKSTELLRPNEELKQSIEAFILDQRSPHTQRAYGKDLKRFMKFLLLRKLEKGEERLDRSVLIAYKDSLLAEGLEHTTIDRHLATLRSFFRWLVDEGRIEKSPVEGVRFLNPKRLSPTIGFTDEEVKKVLAKPDLHTRVGSLHYAILMVLFYCGLRRSELCSLRTSNLGSERGYPVLRLRGKGNAERMIVVVTPVMEAIKHYLVIARKNPAVDQYLFTPIRNNRTGVMDKPVDPSMVFYIVSRYAKLAGIANRVSPHSCRATAISNARDHNVSDRAIQEFAGWASPDMITRYDKRKSSIDKSAAHAIRYGAEDRAVPKWTGESGD